MLRPCILIRNNGQQIIWGNFWRIFSPIKELIMKNRIKEVREAAGLSQSQLGKAIGCKQAMISKIESGDQSITVEQLTHFAETLDVHPAELISAKEWSAPHATGINAPLLQIILRVLAKLLRKHKALAEDIAADIAFSLYQQYAVQSIKPTLAKNIEADAVLLLSHELARRA
jgi:transcriptional regulator with XRE-family HTH domain